MVYNNGGLAKLSNWIMAYKDKQTCCVCVCVCVIPSATRYFLIQENDNSCAHGCTLVFSCIDFIKLELGYYNSLMGENICCLERICKYI